MIKEHNWTLSDLDGMYPYERQGYIFSLASYLEEKKKSLSKNSGF